MNIIVNAFTDTFDQFNACLTNESIFISFLVLVQDISLMYIENIYNLFYWKK